MELCHLMAFLAALLSFFVVLNASAGDADPIYKACVGECEKTGCVGELCFPHCNFSADGNSSDDSWYRQEPSIYNGKNGTVSVPVDTTVCLFGRKKEKSLVTSLSSIMGSGLSDVALEYRVSFFILVNYKLPLRPNKQTYYEYTGLWHIFGILSMNSFIWSAVSRTRDVDLTEKLDYSSAVAALGFSLIVALLRVFNVRDEASRVMVSAPLIAFITTHILYLNFYQLDYSLNMKVCGAMGVAQLLLWAIWAGVTKHPSRWKVWVVVIVTSVATVVEIYDFPPYHGLVDAHAVWHAISIPLSYLLWSFVCDDSEYRTLALVKKSK